MWELAHVTLHRASTSCRILGKIKLIGDTTLVKHVQGCWFGRGRSLSRESRVCLVGQVRLPLLLHNLQFLLLLPLLLTLAKVISNVILGSHVVLLLDEVGGLGSVPLLDVLDLDLRELLDALNLALAFNLRVDRNLARVPVDLLFVLLEASLHPGEHVGSFVVSIEFVHLRESGDTL